MSSVFEVTIRSGITNTTLDLGVAISMSDNLWRKKLDL